MRTEALYDIGIAAGYSIKFVVSMILGDPTALLDLLLAAIHARKAARPPRNTTQRRYFGKVCASHDKSVGPA